MVGVYHDVQQARAASGFFGYMLIAGPYGTLPEHSYCDVYIEMKNPKDADAFIEDWLEGKEYGSYVSWSRHDSLLRWQGVFRNDRYTYMIGGALGNTSGSHNGGIGTSDLQFFLYFPKREDGTVWTFGFCGGDEKSSFAGL